MDIIAKFNLPSYIKGKSFSEASALIAKKFKDRNSREDVDTLNELQGRLQQAQEFVKAEKEAMSKPQNQFKKGGTIEESSSYKFGGFKESQFGAGLQEGASSEELSGSITAGIGGVAALADMGNQAFGSTGIDTSGATAPPDVPSQGASAATGAMKGAAAGKAFGPWGQAVGAVVGGASGLVGGKRAQDDANEAAFNYEVGQHNSASNSYKSGGNMYFGGGQISDLFNSGILDSITSKENNFPDNNSLKDRIVNNFQLESLGVDDDSLDAIESDSQLADLSRFSNSFDSPTAGQSFVDASSDTSNDVKKTDPDKKFNPAESLRYAPSAMNLVQLASLKPHNTIGADRLGNQYNEQYVDEKGLQNTVQNSVNNNRNAILSSSGGDAGAARANLLASQLQGSKALSQAYQQAGAENRQENRAGQQFDLNVDTANIQQSNRAQNLNLEQEAAYRTNKSRLMAQLGQDLGGIGREELFKKYPELMGLSYDWKGRHKKGKKQ